MIDERLHCLERALPKFVTREENEADMKEKVDLHMLEEMKSMLEKTKQVNL